MNKRRRKFIDEDGPPNPPKDKPQDECPWDTLSCEGGDSEPDDLSESEKYGVRGRS